MTDPIKRTRSVSRRSFLRRSGASLASAALVPRHVLGGTGFVPPSDRVNVAVIGTGGQGIVNIKSLFEHPDTQVVAIADVNPESDYSRFYYGGVAGRLPALKLLQERDPEPGRERLTVNDYVDYREMLDREDATIDAVLVATPDHVHAVATMDAIRRGKHVYCEKPLTHSVAEARRIRLAAEEAGVATQMGNQGHSGEGIRQTCEWIWAGAIGPVTEVYAWTGAGNWVEERGRPEETPPVPDGFHWDLWLGPAQYRPYHPAYAPYHWRGWWAFGTAAIGDMACHNLDPAFWALNLRAPAAVQAIETEIFPETVPAESTVRYEFAAREGFPPVTVTWHDGARRPAPPEGWDPNEPLGGNGILFVGETGSILCGGWGGAPTLYPPRLREEFTPPEPSLPRSRGHHRDWLDACKDGSRPSSHFGYSGPLTEMVLLGNVAQRTGERIEWDAEALKVTSHPEANQFVDPPYREGWRL